MQLEYVQHSSRNTYKRKYRMYTMLVVVTSLLKIILRNSKVQQLTK
jgi:hypothetical protein